VAAELELNSLRATGRRRGGARGVVDAIRRRADAGVAAGAAADRASVARLGEQCARRVFAPGETWEVSQVALIRSELLPAGARYTILGEAPLRG
jgi:hypothetical protein